MAGSISVHCVVQCLLPFLPSSQFLLFTPLPAFLSYAGAQLGVNLGESASLGDIHLASISKLPPLVPLIKLPTFLHSLGFNIYTSPLSLSATSCIHLVSYVAPLWPPRNFLQASCFNILKLSRLSATSCIHAVSISGLLPLVSPQLLACIVIWVQDLCAHMV